MTVEQINDILNAERETPWTKAQWRQFRDEVRASLSESTEHLVRWNTQWCDQLDIREATAAHAIAPTY